MDGTCLAVGTVAGEGSFQGGEGKRTEAGVVEDLAEVGSGKFFRKLWVVGSKQRM